MMWQSILQWARDATRVARSRLIVEGQGLVEYALILVFVSVVMVLILTVLGPGISNIYSNIVAILQGQ